MHDRSTLFNVCQKKVITRLILWLFGSHAQTKDKVTSALAFIEALRFHVDLDYSVIVLNMYTWLCLNKWSDFYR